MKKTIFVILMLVMIISTIMTNVSAQGVMIDPNNVVPDTYPVGNLTITSGYSTAPNSYIVAYHGSNYAGETNDNALDRGNVYRITTNSTTNPGEYITYTDVGGPELNTNGTTVTFTISNVLWNNTFDYLPEIYIPDKLDDNLLHMWYTNDPYVYVSYKVTNASSGLVWTRDNVQLRDFMTKLTADRYYKMSEVFRDSAFQEDVIGNTYLEDLVINYLSITIYKQTDTRFDNAYARVRYKTFKTYLDSEGLSRNPLKDYYNYFLFKKDTSTYDKAYQDGYDKGKFDGDREGFTRGYDRGKLAGYQEGYDKGATEGFDFTSWVGNALSNIMNVQFGFITLGSVVGIVVSILIVRWILKIVGG